MAWPEEMSEINWVMVFKVVLDNQGGGISGRRCRRRRRRWGEGECGLEKASYDCE